MFLPKNNMRKAILVFVSVCCFVFSAAGAFAHEHETRKFSLQELLASGQKAGSAYENKDPQFSLEIAEPLREKWSFVVFGDPQAPFYIAQENSAAEGLPFISSMVSGISIDQLAAGKTEYFNLLTQQHEAWEKDVSKGAIVFVNKGSALSICDLDAWERVIENPDTKSRHHLVYIIIGDSLLQLGLNTKIDSFTQDDVEFMSIVRSLKVANSATVSEGALFESRKFGFKIEGPAGWIKEIGSGGKDGEVKFSQTSDGPLPVIAITTDSMGSFPTLLAFTDVVIKDLRVSAEQRQAVFNLIEEPKEIEVNGAKGVRFIYEFVGPIAMRFLDCKFINKDLVVSVMAVDYSGSFDSYSKEFAEALNSFTFNEQKQDGA
jgi:hypothetical protein